MKIFRYLPPTRISWIENEEVFFTPAARFNDPFDLRPVFSSDIKKAYLKQRIKTVPSVYDVLAREKKYPRATRRKEEKKINKAATKDFRENRVRYAENSQREIAEFLNITIGVLCLSSLRDNLLMWAHYADSHKGFVLEFDTEDVVFKNLGDLKEVKYDKTRPIIQPDNRFNFDFMTQKSEDWGYEKEYRIIRKLNQCEKSSSSGSQYYRVPLPRSCVKAVYLGNRMDKNDAAKISGIMKGTAAQLYKCDLHPQEFSLVFNPLK